MGNETELRRETKRAKADLRRQRRRIEKAFGSPMPAEDAQFVETREFQIAEIAKAFGVPLRFLK